MAGHDAEPLAPQLLRALAQVWERGWLPGEVLRQARRHDGALGETICAGAIAAQHAECLRQRGRSLHPAWTAHLDALDLPLVGPDPGWLVALATRAGVSELDVHRGVHRLLALVHSLPPLEVLLPTPGGLWPTRAGSDGAAQHDPILAKVRLLLAKAESTTFPAEADAFTAKAHELMAQHALDAAAVWDQQQRGEQPVAVRIPLDEPYVGPKARLLHAVARRSRCRAVEHSRLAMCTVVGFAPDVAAVELLVTSLLVQAQSALQAETRSAPPGSRVRTRGFRSSFLQSFAVRIDQRLAAVNESVHRAAVAERGGELVPVLTARTAAVDTTVGEMFPHLSTKRTSFPTDGLGWERGRQAADRARLRPDLPA